MDARTLAKLKKVLTSFLDEVAGTLGNPRRRRWCESYRRGVLFDGHHKSVEPMAARLKVIERGEHDYEQGPSCAKTLTVDCDEEFRHEINDRTGVGCPGKGAVRLSGRIRCGSRFRRFAKMLSRVAERETGRGSG